MLKAKLFVPLHGIILNLNSDLRQTRMDIFTPPPRTATLRCLSCGNVHFILSSHLRMWKLSWVQRSTGAWHDL